MGWGGGEGRGEEERYMYTFHTFDIHNKLTHHIIKHTGRVAFQAGAKHPGRHHLHHSLYLALTARQRYIHSGTHTLIKRIATSSHSTSPPPFPPPHLPPPFTIISLPTFPPPHLPPSLPPYNIILLTYCRVPQFHLELSRLFLWLPEKEK